MAGDTLRVQSSAANSIDAMASGVLNDFGGAAAVPSVVVGTQPTYAITGPATANEGATVTYTVTTSEPNGTVLFWDNIGTTTGSDFTDRQNEGSVTVSGGSASISRTLTALDNTNEGNETLIIAIRTRPAWLGGGVLASASTVISDADNIVATGLMLNLDAGRSTSYSGAGTIWSSIGTGGGSVSQGGPFMPLYTTLGGARCFYFNQVGAYFTGIGLFPTPQPADGTNLTIDVWFFPETTELIGTERGNLVRGNNPNSWYMSWNKSTRQQSNYWYGKVPEGYHESGAAITRGTWNNVVAVWTSGGLAQFLNGVKTTVNTTGTLGTKSPDIQIGWEGDGRQFHGGIAAIKIYNTALSDADVAQNFNALRTRFGI
jgi:hypothetical protein